MSKKIRLGISTCPNDTYAFHAILENRIDTRGYDFEIELLDIQQLNDKLFANQFDVAKASFNAAIELAEHYWVMPSGSALGFGVGPLLLSSSPGAIPSSVEQTVLCPGKHTTAALLFRLFYPQTCSMRHVVFSDIMPALEAGAADFGVCIHEGRFTWEQQGLFLVEDLGTKWESQTGHPLPLGGILASKKLANPVVAELQEIVRESLEYARQNESEALLSMRKYAQEFDDDVLMQHVELYVNDWTFELGEIGHSALIELSLRANEAELGPAANLEVFGYTQ